MVSIIGRMPAKGHEQSNYHTNAVEVVIKTTKDVGEMLSTIHAKDKVANSQYLLKMLQNVRFLPRQGLPLRGDGEKHDSNFIQLLHL